MSYFKVSDSNEISQIQKYGHSKLASWSYVIHMVELQLRSQEWVEFIAGTSCLISVSLSSLPPSSLVPLHLMGIVNKYAHAFIVTE